MKISRKMGYAVIVSLMAVALLLCTSIPCEAKGGGTFTVGNKTFLLNGKPFVVKAAEIHYPRIPHQYWEQRIKMCKSLGMNTLCVYVFWNIHEPREGQFDFSGNNDLAAFVRLAEKNGMYVIVRPGPYVCAEWEMGGLPWWLLKKKDIELRSLDPYFMERLRIFEKKVGEKIGGMTIDKGGPIIMVQVENEYGSYGEDKPYVAGVRDVIRQSGFDKVTLFQCDWSSNFTKNGLDDLVWTMNFGTGANIDNEFRKLGELRPNSPKMCSEFWSGWFDKWGARHETRASKAMVDGLREMLDKNISFSLYMTHGGSNWGHWAGANSPGFAPDVTSYDYDAPINEAGQTTEKFWELRKMMANYTGGKKLPAVPAEYPVISIPTINFTEVAPLFENLPAPKSVKGIRTMEEFDQGWGSILYRTHTPKIDTRSVLTVTDVHDFAQVFINGKRIGSIDRRNNEKTLMLPPLAEGDQLDILIEAMGRINFGRAIKDFKGITNNVKIEYETDVVIGVEELNDWQVYNLGDEYADVKGLNYHEDANTKAPGCYRATFNIDKVGDTFLNMETWGKGQVYVNGHPLGRFWHIGPQQTLYMPGCWLKKGENEIIVLDVIGPKEKTVEGLTKPMIDKLDVTAPATHRKAGQNLDLSGETPIKTGQFAAGNGWQSVKFDKPVTGRYFCLEADNSHNNREYACIAELYLYGEDGRISREPWTIAYCDNEDVNTGNKAADKIFDLQESTYWSTEKGSQYPHYIVIDLGSEQTLTELQYLPRVEQGAPESIKDFKLFVKKTPFKY